jgi:hypothetical protein
MDENEPDGWDCNILTNLSMKHTREMKTTHWIKIVNKILQIVELMTWTNMTIWMKLNHMDEIGT